jgi:hypothetical protein
MRKPYLDDLSDKEWKQGRVLEQIHHVLRRELRTLIRRNPEPSAQEL